MWQAPSPTTRDRQAIIRCLVDRVVVHVQRDSAYGQVTMHWGGGSLRQHEVIRPVCPYEQRRDFATLMQRIRALRTGGATTAQIATTLKREGFVPPKRYRPFRKALVGQLLEPTRLGGRAPRARDAGARRVGARYARTDLTDVAHETPGVGGPRLAACPQIPGPRGMDRVGRCRGSGPCGAPPQAEAARRERGSGHLYDTQAALTCARRREELTMAARRLSQVQKRLLAWLARDARRTRGVIVSSHQDLVGARQADKGTLSPSLHTLEARGLLVLVRSRGGQAEALSLTAEGQK